MTTTATITLGNWQGLLGHGAAPRELECLLAIAGGASGKEVARALGISEDGVKKRMMALGTKWGMTKRTALVAEAFRRGIISPAATALALLMAIHGMIGDDQMLRVRRGGNSGERKIETRIATRRAECALAVA
ncbi:LuxR C-terminal-related transcriptional regulator [Pseudomonas sp. GD03651]|uniref:LuxR C-terminal-related transcriptional regulator n=1 Tax=Pseudomonas TaxID=286 RepID=UPI0018D5B2B6|nr:MULTISPECIES: LuxR C-terminal-related transcriptional regulator [Pseudomonas]MBH3412748.1 response regulator transcription factor [Pseudomonas putida]MBS5845987.1 response regulator transcription factor [Pseudomonas putida]MCE0964554.1 LuxR C-terminal-related transcriptional regulator [Pseudomonas sp. NMI4491_12]MCZ9638530.1 LuxR C-terminal-related transcriptional regulator [Pseudomonas putida]MDH2184823.1 LuxR C-terminal-related transcriptional regulator [Pseudomonas sp. GD03651]